jgi:hypothetical protein
VPQFDSLDPDFTVAENLLVPGATSASRADDRRIPSFELRAAARGGPHQHAPAA